MSVQKKYTDLKEFLRCHKTIPEKPFTHTALGQPPHSYPGSYSIDDTIPLILTLLRLKSINR
jgi:hypothetical protein